MDRIEQALMPFKRTDLADCVREAWSIYHDCSDDWWCGSEVRVTALAEAIIDNLDIFRDDPEARPECFAWEAAAQVAIELENQL